MILKIFGLALLIHCTHQRIIPVYEESESDVPEIQTPPSTVSIKTNTPSLVTYAPSQSYDTASFTQQLTSVPHFNYDLKPLQDAPNILVPIKIPLDMPSQIAAHLEEEDDNHTAYEFAYKVEDHQAGDILSQRESRNGDLVHGEYSFHEPDGTIRTVTYTVDKHSGFNAVVKRTQQVINTKPVHRNFVTSIPKADGI